MSALLSAPVVGVATRPGRGTERSELLVGIHERDLEALFVEHYEQLVRSLTVISGNRETARDCVQDAFVKASGRWRKVGRYEDPVGWIRRVAINRARDVHRADERRRRREAKVGLDVGGETDDEAGDVDGSVRVVEMLRRLPTQQRTVAALFYVDDMSIAGIAEVLGLSAGAVKFHLNKARAALRVAVEQEGQSDGYGIRRQA